MCPLHLLWLLRLQLLRLLQLLLQLALLMITMMRLSTKFRPETGGGCRGCSVCASCHALMFITYPTQSTEILASTTDRPHYKQADAISSQVQRYYIIVADREREQF
jgi:hypothetical protein